MDNKTNINHEKTDTNNENLIPILNTPKIFYPFIGLICFMIIVLFIMEFIKLFWSFYDKI
jgi:hypothetical protein